MRFARFAFFIALGCCLYLTSVTLAQTGPEVIDVRPYTPVDGTTLETVSLMNASLSVHIPVWSLAQRGKVKLDFSLAYHDATFQESWTCIDLPQGTTCPASEAYTCPPSTVAVCLVTWYSTGNPAFVGDNSGVRIAASTDVGVFLQYGSGTSDFTGVWYQVRTPDGGSHKLAQTTVGDWRAADGTGWEYQASTCTLRDNEGTQYVYVCTPTTGLASFTPDTPGVLLYEEDTNGNRITLNYTISISTSGNTTLTNYTFTGWTDTVGRSISAIPNVGQAATTGCPAGSSDAISWQLPGVSPAITICQTSVPVHTGFLTSLQQAKPTQYSEDMAPFTAISGLILPSGDEWTFSYTPVLGDPSYGTDINYGNLTQIGLPTGGSIQYIWGQQRGFCGMGAYQLSNSVLGSRTIQVSASSAPQVWTYSWSQYPDPSDPVTYQTTVVDPYGNRAVHTLTDQNGCSYYETKVATYDNANHLFQTVDTAYQALSEVPFVLNSTWSGYAALPIATHTIWPDGTSKTTAWTYDSGFQTTQDVAGTTVSVPYGNKILSTDYNYGTNDTPGSALRTVVTDYFAFDSAPALIYNILSAPSSVTVTDSVSGAIQKTTYGYDETALTAGNASPSVGTPPAVIWDSNPPNGSVRGNQTSVSGYLNTTGGNLKTAIAYTNTGTVSSVQLPLNSPYPDTTTTYAYSTAYQGALLTTETNALGQSQSNSYNPNTSLQLTKTDENGNTTTYNYYSDTRLQSIVYPTTSTGQPETDYNYPSPTQVEKKQKQNTSTWVTSETFYDGLGRTIETQLLNGCSNSDFTETDTTYDLDGRVASISNPHCGASKSPSDGVTLHGTMQGGTFVDGYDALGRPTFVTDSDGTGIQSWSYSDDSTTFANENGSRWTRTLDALGRLANVVEPGSLPTSYSYDAFGNLTKVSQTGNSALGDVPRVRSFTYDSLSRLWTSLNPESGSESFTYDAHGNVLTKTDARGITTHFGYDALNRVVSKTYSGDTTGTPISCYQYDLSSVTNGIGRLANVWTQPETPRTTSSCTGTAPNYAPVTGSYIALKSNLGYDAMGRLKEAQENQCIGSTCAVAVAAPYQINMGYDLAGNMTTLANSLGSGNSPLQLTNSYDGASRLCLTTVSSDRSGWNTNFPETLFQTNPSTSTPGYTPFGSLQNWWMGYSTSAASTGCTVTPPSPPINVTQRYTNRLWVNSTSVTGQIP
jgi:YD repeat-containing protein